jgi:acyl-CoA thioester hydrolase
MPVVADRARTICTACGYCGRMMSRGDFAFFHPLRVRWSEVDRQDVVFNANYFVYFDVAVGEYWRAIDFRYPSELEPGGTDIFALKATAEFHASATYDDIVDVGCRVARIGRSSMRVVLAVFRGDEHLTSGELIYVHADKRARTSTPWPPSLRDRIVAFERVAPELG